MKEKTKGDYNKNTYIITHIENTTIQNIQHIEKMDTCIKAFFNSILKRFRSHFGFPE